MHRQLLSLMMRITHTNIPHPLLRNLLPTQIRYRHVKRPPPPLTPRDQNKEDYWEAVISYLDPPDEGRTEKRKLESKFDKFEQKKFQQRKEPQSNVGFDFDSEPIKSESMFISPARDPIGRKSGAKYKNRRRESVLSEVYQSMDDSSGELGETRENYSDKAKVNPSSNEQSPKEFKETTDLEVFEENVPVESGPKFLEMLRESNWMKMGDPRQKMFRGIVINQIGNQVYVDYGYKFYGVFKIPEGMEPEQFVTGTKLLVLVKELELTQHFLGEDSLFSLLESEIQFQSLIE